MPPLLVPVGVRTADINALEELGLLEDGERDAQAIGCACATSSPAAVARIGEALWLDGDGERA